MPQGEAQLASAITHQAQHERVLAAKLTGRRGQVERQPGAEPRDQASRRTPGQPERDHAEKYQVWRSPARQRQAIDDRELDYDDGRQRNGRD